MKYLKFVLCLVFSFQSVAFGQSTEDRDYWISRYLSVSYPLRSIQINSHYGNRRDPFTGKRTFHNGLDLKAYNEEVMSMFDGVVTKVGKDNRSGVFVVLQHGDYKVSYCHLSKIAVLVGDTVIAGDIVGISGNSGRSTGPHLHISAQLRDKSINPYDLLLYIKEVRKESFIAMGGKTEGSLSPEDFLERYAPIAMEQQRKYGIPASVTLAQMAYESAWGQSDLARNGNNFFGIKASRAWLNEGKPYSLHDDDRRNEAFCNYKDAKESIEHHSDLLMSDRYKRCRKYSPTDYHNWLVSIKSAGYATAKNYVTSCERIIKHHKLYLYDRLAVM